MKQTRRRFLRSAIALGIAATIPTRVIAVSEQQHLSEFAAETMRRMSAAKDIQRKKGTPRHP